MSASTGDLQPLVDEILELMGARICVGQIVINLNDYKVQSVETKTHHRVKKALDAKAALSAR